METAAHWKHVDASHELADRLTEAPRTPGGAVRQFVCCHRVLH